MKTKWAVIWLNLSWLFSFLFWHSAITVYELLEHDFGTGTLFGTSIVMSRGLGVLGFYFLIVIVGNLIAERRKSK